MMSRSYFLAVFVISTLIGDRSCTEPVDYMAILHEMHAESGLKDVWPEAVGLKYQEAEQIISEERPELYVEVIGPDASYVAEDFQFHRVQLFVDADDIVIRTPSVG